TRRVLEESETHPGSSSAHEGRAASSGSLPGATAVHRVWGPAPSRRLTPARRGPAHGDPGALREGATRRAPAHRREEARPNPPRWRAPDAGKDRGHLKTRGSEGLQLPARGGG